METNDFSFYRWTVAGTINSLSDVKCFVEIVSDNVVRCGDGMCLVALDLVILRHVRCVIECLDQPTSKWTFLLRKLNGWGESSPS